MKGLQIIAADWLVRIQNDELSVEEIATWQQWLAADPAHRKAFEHMQDLWQSFERLPDKTPPTLENSGLRSVNRVFGWRMLAAAAAIAAVAIGIVTLRPARELTLFETQAGQHREVTLPDGSRLTVGAQSLVWIRFVDTAREVGLDRGEAFFDVARDSRRPFTVRAGETTITALGTAFNVHKAGERVQVAVTDGAVRVRDKRVEAGERITVEPSLLATAHVRPSAPGSAAAWRSGRLEYLGEPLKYVIADVNRYSSQQISIRDAEVGELQITGTVFENDIESWLRSVESLLPVKVERPEPGKILLTRR